MDIQKLGEDIANDFVSAASLAGLAISRSDVEVQALPAPHRAPSSLPKGKLGVYVFLYGKRCLKVGKAGPKSSARFCSHHYRTNAPSTLAKSLLANYNEFGLTELRPSNIKDWICENTSRLNFLLPAKYGDFALSFLESFVQCRLRPEFEGFANQRQQSESAT